MNKKLFWSYLAAAVLAMILFGLVPESGTGSLMVLALPFTLIGSGLRALSLSGALGNVAAIILYVLVCLFPMAFVLKRKWNREDWLLPLTSVLMFYVMYLMINPGLMPVSMGSDVGKLIYASAVYSVLVSWGLLKLLRASETVRQEQIYRALRIFLLICAGECILVGFGVGFWDLRASIAEIKAENTMYGLNLMPTYIFELLIFTASAVEYGLDAVVMLWGVKLLRELEQDAYSESCCEVAEKISKLCKWVLMTITLMNLGLNLGQVIFAARLHNVDATLYIPVFSMALVFGTLALTRLLSQGRALKEDNDLFI